MISRSVTVGLLAAGCLTAAAGGSYLAVRQNAADRAVHAQQPATTAVPAGDETPVHETEALVTPEAAPAPAAPAVEPPVERPAVPAAPPATERRRTQRPPEARAASAATAAPAAIAASAEPLAAAPVDAALPAASYERAPEPAATEPEIPGAPERVFEEIVVPVSSVIGLEVERTITSEQAVVEDRVEARVSRDVYAGGRLAIPAGSRVIGHVTLVERGGKMKDRARLGVRFHTLVLADGRQMPLRTETIYREGDSPGAESSRKIGGAAIGGAVLGGILGGGKGAATGAAVGAAGGTAAVMAGGRNPATLASGSIVNVRLSAPVAVEVER
ncbi:MAG TPA: TrbI/VirB10 family protein [Vicinamibacterales bacterium]|nr:TrbI/VirB10 family protein [Vicinamibacterales bacterium]